MPRGDGTGPAGRGPLTGRQMGYCAGSDQPGFASPAGGFRRFFGGNWGMGRGRGRGMGQGYFAANPDYVPPEPPVTQKAGLENAIESLKSRLSFLEKQLAATEKED